MAPGPDGTAVNLGPENFRGCGEGELLLDSDELAQVTRALQAQAVPGSTLQWTLEPSPASFEKGRFDKEQFLKRKNMKMADPSEEEVAGDGEGSVSAMSGSVLSVANSKDLSGKNRQRFYESLKDQKSPEGKGGAKPVSKPTFTTQPGSMLYNAPSRDGHSEVGGADSDVASEINPGSANWPGRKDKILTDHQKPTERSTPKDYKKKKDPKVAKDDDGKDLKDEKDAKPSKPSKPSKAGKDEDGKDSDDKGGYKLGKPSDKKRPKDDNPKLKTSKASKRLKGSKDDVSGSDGDSSLDRAEQQLAYLEERQERLTEAQRDQVTREFGQELELGDLDQPQLRRVAQIMAEVLGEPLDVELFQEVRSDSPPAS